MPRVNLGMGEREKLYLEELRERTGAGMMNQTEFAEYIGVQPQAAAKMLEGLPCQKFGRQKRYNVRDLAKMLARRENC